MQTFDFPKLQKAEKVSASWKNNFQYCKHNFWHTHTQIQELVPFNFVVQLRI